MHDTAVMSNNLGEWLEREFERKGWDTLQKASQALDLPVQTIHDVLRKPNKRPSPVTLRKLADGLAVSLEFLFERMRLPSERGGVPTEGRALPESVRGLTEEGYDFLSRMTPAQLERWLRLMEENQRRSDP
jgi:transcriptional regulator with XRE-family HTH domain